MTETLFSLTPLGAAVLEPHLDSCLTQFQLQSQLFPAENVGVLGLLKHLLQLVELVSGEGCPTPAAFSHRVVITVVYLQGLDRSINCSNPGSIQFSRIVQGWKGNECRWATS